MTSTPSSPSPNPRRLPDKPRRVQRGVKLSLRVDRLGTHPLTRRWLDDVRACVSDQALFDEGISYARLGQIISLEVRPGRIESTIQGRCARAYRWSIAWPTFEQEACERIISSLSGEARLAHGLGEGEISRELLDVLDAHAMALLPVRGAQGATPTCTCPQVRDGKLTWCKHAVAAAHLFAERLDAQPALAWTIRGVDPVELAERIRLKRTIDSGAGPATAHQPLDRSILAVEPQPLDCLIDSFYDLRPEIASFETRLALPEVSHVLVRRLGPSPFPESRFRILGLLSTCYDLVSGRVMKETLNGNDAD